MIIKENSVTLETLKGPMLAYVYQPVEEGRYPGLLFFPEIFQQTGPIKRTAAFMAGHGYVVAVPEIFHEFETPGTVIPYDQEGADLGNKHKVSKELASYDSDARALISFLSATKECNGKIGVMGICIGGHLAFRAAMNKEVAGTACFYATDIHKRSLGLGMNDDSLDRIKEIHGEVLMIWGRQDPHIPAEGRALINQRLLEAGTKFTWHEFNAQHAFMRDEGQRYDPELVLLCYQLVLAFFQRTLR